MPRKQPDKSIIFPSNVYDVHGDYVGNIVFRLPQGEETLIGAQTAIYSNGFCPVEFASYFRKHLTQRGRLRVSHLILEDDSDTFITPTLIKFVDHRGNIHLNIGLYELAS
jgi:hypothetical protein